MKKTLILKIFLILSLLGLIVSGYLTNEHYATESSFCDVGEVASCSLVNSSIYSEFLNVPVAVFGMLWFVFFAIFSIKAFKDKKGYYITSLFVWNLIGLLSVVYLVTAEFLLKAICPFCTVVHFIIILMLPMTLYLYKKEGAKLKGTLKKMKSLVVVLILINLLPLLFFNLSFGEKADYNAEAMCITEKGVNMYGSFRCGVCAKTRDRFGEAFVFINEIECHPLGENSQTELCLGKGIEGTPTWVLEPNGVEEKRHTGFLSVEELAEFAGCPFDVN